MFMTALSYFCILVLTCMALVIINATVKSIIRVWSNDNKEDMTEDRLNKGE